MINEKYIAWKVIDFENARLLQDAENGRPDRVQNIINTILIENDDNSLKGIPLHERSNIKYEELRKSVFKSDDLNMVSEDLV